MLNQDEEEIPLAYSIDNAILMHRDAHFGGNFDLMLDYYKKNGRGISQEFDVARIEQLYRAQRQGGKDLAPLLLSGAEAEKIARVRMAYKRLRSLYEVKNQKNRLPLLIADLILAEEEDLPAAIDAVVAEKGTIVPSLIELLRSEDFYDPLFPGYGEAPTYAAQCLGKIGDQRAIISLFEAIGDADFYSEGMLLEALHAIGTPAKTFLLRVLHSQPINADNEKAAVALIAFKGDPEVVEACINMLETIDLKNNELFATYLVLACEAISSPEQRKRLLELAQRKDFPKNLQKDIQLIAQNWSL